MRSLALLLSSFSLGFAIQCPDGFRDPHSTGNCYQFEVDGQAVNKTRSSAQTWCAESNATLPMVRNTQSDGTLYSSLPSGYVWLALTCTTSDPFSCIWDDGTPLRDGDYQSFAPGHPRPSLGTCVYKDVYSNSPTNTKNQWLSASCNASAYSVCEYEYGLQYSLCPDGSRFFNGSCYFGMISYSVSEGTSKCKLAGGNLASIHSDAENYIVLSVARILEPTSGTSIGLTLSNNAYSWTDGSAVDYLNFGIQDKTLGNNVEMALIDRLIQQGQWINFKETTDSPVNMVCKIPATKIKNATELPKTEISPTKCSSSILIKGMGTLVSPGYPNSDVNTCQYLLSVDSGRASISFLEISLDSNSKISLFNNIFDKNPVATITNTKNDTKFYQSTGNSLTMIFTTNGSSGNHFRGVFGQPQPSCQSEGYYGSGNFTSPNYPSAYPSGLNCEYRLYSSKNRIALSFNKFYTSQNYDNLKIYDGNGPLLAQLTGSHNNYVVSSITNSLRLVFTTSNSNTGFSADFISIV